MFKGLLFAIFIIATAIGAAADKYIDSQGRICQSAGDGCNTMCCSRGGGCEQTLMHCGPPPGFVDKWDKDFTNIKNNHKGYK